MKGGDKIHPAEQALLQRCDLIQTSQLIQQDHLWRKAAQYHLHCLSLGEPGKNIQRLAGRIPGKELPPFINDRKDLLLPDELPGNTAQQCGLAAARLSNKKHPDEMPPQCCGQFLWKRNGLFPGNAQVDRGELLQNRALFRVLQKTPAKPCPTSIFQCDIALCDLCLMGMD